MRRREDSAEPMSPLQALSVKWFTERDDERRRELVLRFLGRLPGPRDVARAREVLAAARGDR